MKTGWLRRELIRHQFWPFRTSPRYGFRRRRSSTFEVKFEINICFLISSLGELDVRRYVEGRASACPMRGVGLAQPTQKPISAQLTANHLEMKQ